MVTRIPITGTEVSPSPSPILPLSSPVPSPSTPSSDKSSSSSSLTTSHECFAGVPDVTSDSSEIGMSSSSQDNEPSEQVDVESVQSGEQLSLEDSSTASVNTGYKLVFDNIDKNVRPRHMRSDNQTRSLHYVQSYAVKDRVNYDSFSSEVPTIVNVFDVLPTEEDYKCLKMNFAILVSRMIVKYIPYFASDYSGLPVKHIPHEHSTEMGTKSEIVS